MRVEEHLTDEERAIQETARAFCQETLQPKVVDMYRNECEIKNCAAHLAHNSATA